MDKLKLGQIITEPQERDAIHVAVAPVVAGEPLTPGTHVGPLDDGRYGCCKQPIGIVDPFLSVRCVLPGQSFWLYLYPGSITSLRHDWTHPAFGAVEPAADIAAIKAESEAWLRDFAKRACMTYEELISRTTDFLQSGWPWTEQGSERARNAFYDDQVAFWEHFETVTGKPVSDRDTAPFSCSC